MTLIDVEFLHSSAKLPTKATKYSACYDLRACLWREVKLYTGYNDVGFLGEGRLFISPKQRVIVPTGLKFNISPGFHVKIYPRSSVPLKSGLLMVNSVGIIDEDYKDEIMILLINMSDDTVVIENGDRIAQMEVVNNQSALVFMNEQEVLIERNGGLGSTGV